MKSEIEKGECLRLEYIGLLDYYIKKIEQLLKIHPTNNDAIFFMYSLKGGYHYIEKSRKQNEVILCINIFKEKIRDANENDKELSVYTGGFLEELELLELRYSN